MALWYEQYRMPPGATRRYQYAIFDSVQTARVTTSIQEASNLTRAMPRLDMLVMAPDHIELVELKPNVALKDVGQVLQYEKYLRRDIFLQQHMNQPIRRILVSLRENVSVRLACEAEGIEYMVIPISELPPLPD
jgi:hypothetical protein